MQTEEIFLQFIFSNQLVFCGIFGALGGIVYALDLRVKMTIGTLISKMIISCSAGILLFFITYDIATLTPSLRIAASIVVGFYGSALFRYLARVYLEQMLKHHPCINVEMVDEDPMQSEKSPPINTDTLENKGVNKRPKGDDYV